MVYKIEIAIVAKRVFDKLPKDVQRGLAETIDRLAEHPDRRGPLLHKLQSNLPSLG